MRLRSQAAVEVEHTLEGEFALRALNVNFVSPCLEARQHASSSFIAIQGHSFARSPIASRGASMNCLPGTLRCSVEKMP